MIMRTYDGGVRPGAGRKPSIDAEQYPAIHRMIAQGMTYAEIGRKIGVSTSAVQRLVGKIRQTGKLAHQKVAIDTTHAGMLLQRFQGDWRKVIDAMPTSNGQKPTYWQIYQQMRRDGVPTKYKNSVRGRPKSHHATDPNSTVAMAFWVPPLPKPLSVVPDYRTDTVRSTAAAEILSELMEA